MSHITVNPVTWIASSYKDFREFPEPVQDAMGYALYQAQIGEKHSSAKPLKGKKSKSGIKTPTEDMELIRRRLKAAADDYKIQLGTGEAL